MDTMEAFSNLPELSTRLYEMIIDEKIRTFSQLIEYTGYIFTTPPRQVVLMSAFKLIRKLYWGFFKDIDYPSYPKLWKELVIPDRKYRYAGNIKRNSTISNIYIAVLDVHGYTAFCRQNSRNLSMLHLLDTCIQGDIGKITQEHNVLSRREHGDEIILAGTTAVDILHAVLSIVDYFSRRKVLSSDLLSRSRPGFKVILPDMYISAGIAGGKMYTPLILTEGGDLSGDVINTAARLQNRANSVSPSSTRITVTKQVVFRYTKECAGTTGNSGTVEFFNSGIISFKGTSLAISEVVFEEKNRYVLQYQTEMQELYSSLEKKLWQNQVFPALITLIIKVCRNMAKFKLKLAAPGHRRIEIGNDDIIKLAEKALLLYSTEDNYSKAVTYLRRIVDYLGRIQKFDSLVLAYARKITDLYEKIAEDFRVRVEERLDDRYESVFSPKTAQVYKSVKKQALLYEKLKEQAMEHGEVLQKKSIWYALIEEHLNMLGVSLYSGKS